MDFGFTREQQEFREEIRRFLREVLPDREKLGPEWGAGFSREFSQKLGKKGWIGIAWPRENGGQARSYVDRMILIEELFGYGAPCLAHRFGERQIGPALMKYGNEEQKKEFLPQIIQGNIVFCIGMSEPEAGSDLASLKTRAVLRGDDFILSGQKVWTSGAHLADYCYLVARTDPEVPKHRGISEFIIDLKWPGIEIRPLVDLTGEHHFNEVFFDDVRVPKKYLIGEENRGWYQIASQVDYERGGIEQLMDNYPLYEIIVKFIQERGLAEQPLIRSRLAQLEIEFAVGRLLCYRVAWSLSQGGKPPSHEAAMAKVFGAEFTQRVARLSVQILGLYGQLVPSTTGYPLQPNAARNYMHSFGYTFGGGTSEILRNLIAIRGLGLPTQ